MKKVHERFLHYVSFDTTSDHDSTTYPSTETQLILAKEITKELTQLGLINVKQDEYGYVTATLPASPGCEGSPKIAFIAHMDTSPAVSGKDIKPRIVNGYDGGKIVLNEEKRIFLSPEDFPNLSKHIGDDLIVTDGTTLLGADDKAGIAEIINMVEYFLNNPSEKHGEIKIGFTPDEEVGRGTDYFDVESFGADFGYTVDGGILGELSYENFNAASVLVTVSGQSIHTGDAKGKMTNACLIAMEYNSMLPCSMRPENTEGYEGFFHLDQMSGNVEHTTLKYIIRDHDNELFESKKRLAKQISTFLNTKYCTDVIQVEIKDSYYNMLSCILPNMHIVESIKNAMQKNGITPNPIATRGGTDGARLSFKGLPCPNICTGGQNFHGRFEYISINSMEKIVDVLIDIVKGYAN